MQMQAYWPICLFLTKLGAPLVEFSYGNYMASNLRTRHIDINITCFLQFFAFGFEMAIVLMLDLSNILGKVVNKSLYLTRFPWALHTFPMTLFLPIHLAFNNLIVCQHHHHKRADILLMTCKFITPAKVAISFILMRQQNVHIFYHLGKILNCVVHILERRK